MLFRSNDYYYGYEDDNGKTFEGYKSLVEKLTSKFAPGVLMQSEAEQKEFIKLYGAILKVTNILSSFDEFKDDELINERDKQDYHSIYIELYNEFRNKAKQENSNMDTLTKREENYENYFFRSNKNSNRFKLLSGSRR